jgi:hypothetical protein
MTLTEYKYIWAVTFLGEDGQTVIAAYFTDKIEADRFCQKKQFGYCQRVVQHTLWKDDNNVFYTVNYKNADVDKYVHIRNALNKLTEQEKLALDIKYH